MCLTVGAAALGFWCSLRFPGRGPRTLVGASAHVVASIVVVQLATLALQALADDHAPIRATVLLVLGFVPALAYAFLSAMWLMRLAAQLLFRA